MATQRVIPVSADSVPAQVITITAGAAGPVPTPMAVFIQGSGQQPVTFFNNSGASVNINIDPNPIQSALFVDVEDLGNGDSDTQTPPSTVTDAAANYYLESGGQTTGPFAIQIGDGPLYIQVTDSATGPITNPDPVAIPYGGTLEMVPGDTNSYSVKWTGADPFDPPITSVDSTPHQEDISAVAGYGYTVKKISPLLGTGNGGGTIKVGST